MRPTLSSMAVLLVASARLAAVGPPGEELQLPRSKDGLPVMTVRVGSETLRLGIDTGTSRSFVSAEAAERMRLEPRRRLSLGGVGGARGVGALCGPVGEVRIVGLAITLECVGWVPEERRLAGAEDLDGLLGADVLAHVDLLIDLRGRRVRTRFAAPGSLSPWIDGRRVALEFVGSRPAVDTKLAGLGLGDPDARLILDSGTNGLILFGGLARRAGIVAGHRRTPGRLESATSRRDVAIVPLLGLRAGGSFFAIGSAGLLPELTSRPEDGLLPLSVLGPVFLDMANRVVVADARLRTTPRATTNR